jgi:hypothetical protein
MVSWATGFVGWRTEFMVREVHRLVPDVEDHGGHAVVHVVAGDVDRIGRVRGSRRLQEYLSAASVELWVRRRGGGVMKGKQLGTNEVVPAKKIFRDRDGEVSVVVDHFLGAPFVGGGIVTVVEDLEPARARSLVDVKEEGRIFHVDGAGTFVRGIDSTGLGGVGVFAELEGEGVAGRGWADEGDRGFAVDSCILVSVKTKMGRKGLYYVY